MNIEFVKIVLIANKNTRYSISLENYNSDSTESTI